MYASIDALAGRLRKNEQIHRFSQPTDPQQVRYWYELLGAIHVTFAADRDEGAPDYPLILAIDWPHRDTVEAFLSHPIRKEGRAATEAVLARHFTGRIHHHVTAAHEFAPTLDAGPGAR